MSELKTLKYFENKCDSGYADSELMREGKMELIKELREAALEWIKSIREDIYINIYGDWDVGKKAQIVWIMHFFDLEEEEHDH